MKKTVLITGSSKGIGLEFVRQFAELNYEVIASCRKSSKALSLKEFGKKIKMRELEITAENQLLNLKEEFYNKPIDIMILNGAVFGQRDVGIGNIDVDDMIETFKINAIYQLKIIEAFREHLLRGKDKKIIVISSVMGCSDHARNNGGDYAYRGSKAALNTMISAVSHDLAKDGVKMLLLHPGWVRTNMGGDHAPLTADESVKSMIEIINGDFENGGFLDYRGDKIQF